MARLDEIRARVDEIETELRGEGCDVDKLTTELDELFAEQANIETNANKRNAYLDAIANNKTNTKVIERMNETMNTTYNASSPEYREAWLMRLQNANCELSDEQRAAMDSTTASAGYAIPTLTLNKVIENLKKIAPMLAYVDLMHVPQYLVIPVEGTVNNAAVHAEAATMTPAGDTINRITLNGKEICKLLEISATVKRMAVDAFESWLVSNLSRSIALELENEIINGDGGTTVAGHGINAAETWVDGTNAVDWASAAPTTGEIIEAIGLIPAAYATNAKMFMNHKTFWNRVFNLRDDKFPAVVMGEGGNYYCFGFPVVISNKVADDVIFMGDAFEGVKANFAQDVQIEQHEDFKAWGYCYRATCIFDTYALAGRWVKCAASL